MRGAPPNGQVQAFVQAFMEHSADQLSLTRVLHLLRCPRCCELPPAGPIYACERGHTLCGRCYDHLEKGGEPDEAFRCVVCHARLCGDRNMVAEQLVRSLGKRALARSRQRMVGLEDGMVGVVSDRRPSLIVIRSNTDNPPVTLPPPPPPAPLPSHSRPRPRPKPSSLFSAHASVPCMEQPCRPGCTCTRCTAMVAFYNAWLPSENTQMPVRPPTHTPPTPPLVPPETPSPREASPGSPATGTCPTHCPTHYHSLHSAPLPAPPPTRVASGSTRPRSPVPADDVTPWAPAATATAGATCAAATAATASRRGASNAPPRPPPSAASGTSSAMAVAADAYRPHPGGDASAFACACRCTCVYSCPCARANTMYAGAASSCSMPVCGSQSTSPEERRLPSMRPVRCPKPSCSTLLSASALVQHFAFDHSEVPLLPVDPGDETQLWLSASDIPLEMAKVQALLLLPILSGDKGSLRPTSEPLMSRYGLRRPLPLLTGRCRLAAATECGTVEDNSKPRRVGDEIGAENSTSANTSTDVTINSTGATPNSDEVDDEDHSIRKEDTIVMWLADVEAATNYSMEVSDGVRKYSYSAPAVALRSPQTPRCVYRSGEAATLTGSFVRRVARAGGFTLTVVVQ